MMRERRCHIFNPDTEMAMAVGHCSYTPPLRVSRMIEQQILLPALYADSGDMIAVPDKLISHITASTLYHDVAKARDIDIIPFSAIGDNLPEPWGWNLPLRSTLIKAGVCADVIPSAQVINNWRELANRNTAIKVLRETIVSGSSYPTPIEITTTAHDALCAVQQFAERGYKSVVKFPWSSSGRGVFFIPDTKIISDAIAHQGSVVIEPLWDKTLDFASEWRCEDGRVYFSGYSLFINSGNGRYTGNIVADDDTLRAEILKHCESRHLDESLERLREALERHIAPVYDGPLGVDMLCDTHGEINPCVEINLRMTMGHVANRIFQIFGTPGDSPYIFRAGEPFTHGLRA